MARLQAAHRRQSMTAATGPCASCCCRLLVTPLRFGSRTGRSSSRSGGMLGLAALASMSLLHVTALRRAEQAFDLDQGRESRSPLRPYLTIGFAALLPGSWRSAATSTRRRHPARSAPCAGTGCMQSSTALAVLALVHFFLQKAARRERARADGGLLPLAHGLPLAEPARASEGWSISPLLGSRSPSAARDGGAGGGAGMACA
jgi:hypothetical protein